MRIRVENRCSNCNKRNECKDRGEIVEWKHCRQFVTDPVLYAQEKLRREALKAAREAKRNDSSCG